MESLLHDIRFSFRQIRRSPAFAFFIIATLAIGIGANTTIFSALNALLLRPLPYANGHELVQLSGAIKDRGNDWSVSLPNAIDWGEMNHTLSDVGFHQDASLTLARDGATPERLSGERVSANFFDLLGASAAVGRIWTAEEAVPNAPAVIVLSNALWRRSFGADPAIVGKSINLSGNDVTVIGVMPATFNYPSDRTEFYSPIYANKVTWNRANGGLQVVGRLMSGKTVQEAQRDLNEVSKTLAQEYPGTNEELTAFVQPLRSALTGGQQTATMLYIVLGAVGLVLLIACVNVANLLLARATAREREVAVRAAMGAARWRVIRQFLTESLMLALCGGLAGALIAYWGTNALPQLIPEDAGITRDFGLDGRVLSFTIILTALTGLLFGAAPALKASSAQLTQLLGGRTGASTKARGYRRNLLVIAEVALAVVLLVSAGLMLRSFGRLTGTNPGFQAENLLTMRVSLDSRYKDVAQVLAFQDRMLAAIHAVPGVQHASTADYLPLSGTNNFNDLLIEGRPGKPENVGSVMVGPNYARTMGIPVAVGREIDSRDAATAPGVVMVNRQFADKYFPGENPVGKRVAFGWESSDSPGWRTIVGVFGNVLHGGLDTEVPRTEVYAPITQLPWRMGAMHVAVRTQGDPVAALDGVRRAIWSVDPALAVYETRTMDRMIHDSNGVFLSRLLAGALGMFGAIALLLAAIGLYGVISYSVAQRTYEIGVRAALGADTSAVLNMVLRQGLKLVGVGLGIGLIASFGATRVLASMLYGVKPTDPVSFAGMSLLLVAVATVATVIPARRAARIDPILALRAE